MRCVRFEYSWVDLQPFGMGQLNEALTGAIHVTAACKVEPNGYHGVTIYVFTPINSR